MEAMYNLLLGVFSIVGAVRFGLWLMKRKNAKGKGTDLGVKAIGLIFTGLMLVAGLDLMSGGPATDLRILSEIFGTAGAIIAAQWLMTRPSIRSNTWAQVGVVLFTVVFLAVTWWEQLNDIRSGGLQSVIPTPTMSAPAGVPTSTHTPVSPLCFTNPPPPPENKAALGCP